MDWKNSRTLFTMHAAAVGAFYAVVESYRCLPDKVFAIQAETNLLQDEGNLLCLCHGTECFLHGSPLNEQQAAGSRQIPH